MTKLKTLKEIELEDYVCAGSVPPKGFNGVEAKIVWSNTLRQEVIKHIKSGTMVEGAKFWAIGFFNLKEEELK